MGNKTSSDPGSSFILNNMLWELTKNKKLKFNRHILRQKNIKKCFLVPAQLNILLFIKKIVCIYIIKFVFKFFYFFKFINKFN